MQSTAYKICLAFICLYIGYLILAAFGASLPLRVKWVEADRARSGEVGRVGELDEKRSCHIGLKLWV